MMTTGTRGWGALYLNKAVFVHLDMVPFCLQLFSSHCVGCFLMVSNPFTPPCSFPCCEHLSGRYLKTMSGFDSRVFLMPTPPVSSLFSQVKALTLFVTHYPPLCELEHVYPEHVSNYHMAFLLNEPDIAADTDGACACVIAGTRIFQHIPSDLRLLIWQMERSRQSSSPSCTS